MRQNTILFSRSLEAPNHQLEKTGADPGKSYPWAAFSGHPTFALRLLTWTVKLDKPPILLSRFTFLLGALAMFGLATAGVVIWASGFAFLKEALLEGVPYFFGTSGSQIWVPGRLLGTFAVIVPVFGAVGGIWLLRLAFEREE